MMRDDIIEQQQNFKFWASFFKIEEIAQMQLGPNEALTITARDRSGQKNTYTGLHLKKTRKRAS